MLEGKVSKSIGYSSEDGDFLLKIWHLSGMYLYWHS